MRRVKVGMEKVEVVRAYVARCRSWDLVKVEGPERVSAL